MSDELEEILDRRRRAALSLDDFSLLAEVDAILRRYMENERVNAAMDEIRNRVLGRRHPATISDLHSKIKNSTICPGHTLVLPKGNVKDPRIVFVCYALTKETVEPLSEALKKAGFSSEHVALTSVIRCSYDHPITDDDVVEYLPYLWEELKIWRPRCVVPLGSECAKLLFGEAFKITSDRGTTLWLDEYCFIPTYSPKYANSSSSKLAEFMEDLSAVKSFSE